MPLVFFTEKVNDVFLFLITPQFLIKASIIPCCNLVMNFVIVILRKELRSFSVCLLAVVTSVRPTYILATTKLGITLCGCY